MTYCATLSTTWRNRQIMITLCLLGLAGWFFYDGAIGFPKKNERFLAFRELQQQGREQEWAEFARSKGWPRREPEKYYKPVDLKGQFVLGTLALVGSLTAAGWLVVGLRQQIRCDDEAITGPHGERVPFSAITGFDHRKWESKGIVFALYNANGRQRRLVLDDYKFAGAEAIIKQAEAYVAGRTQSRQPPDAV